MEPEKTLVTLRPFRDTDADVLQEIYRVAVRVLGSRQYSAQQVEAWASLAPAASDHLRRTADGRAIWIATDAEDRPLAYADLDPDGHIDHLYCHPDAAGRDIGAALVLTLEAVARSLDCRDLHVEASETARPLFERLGYRTERRREIERGGVELHNFAMTRTLPVLSGGDAPTPATEAMMAEYASAQGLAGPRASAHQVVAFGDSPAMMDELADLALLGIKRATAGLLRDFAGGEPMPHVGGHVVLVDGSGAPRAVWRTQQVRFGPLVGVDEAFAWDEGEGERTRDDWLEMHRRYFARTAHREGFAMHDRMPTVFERFQIVWPQHQGRER